MKKSRLYLVLAILFGLAGLVHLVLALCHVIDYPLCQVVHWILLIVAAFLLIDGDRYKQKAVSHLKLLLISSAQDGELNDKEGSVLMKYAQKLGFSKKLYLKVLGQLASNPQVQVYTPETEKEKEEILSSLSEVMVADGKVDAKEVEFIRTIAGAFGVDPTPYIDVPKPRKRNEYDEAADAKPGKKRK